MHNYDLVVFDLDGTLLDTSSGILACMDFIVNRYGLPAIPDEIKRSFIGPPIQNSFQHHFGCRKEQAWEYASAWRNAYKERFLFQAVPYDGIYSLLQWLRQEGIKTAVATNKREDYTHQLLDYFNFIPLFDCVIGSDLDGKRTKTDMIRLCIEFVGIDAPERCIMVGDTEGDRVAAQNAGAAFLGVSYGFGYQPGKHIPSMAMASSCGEIAQIIERKIRSAAESRENVGDIQ